MSFLLIYGCPFVFAYTVFVTTHIIPLSSCFSSLKPQFATSLFILHVLCLIATQDNKGSRKHITSTAPSNLEPRKESLPLGSAVNESSLLLEVRNCCMCIVWTWKKVMYAFKHCPKGFFWHCHCNYHITSYVVAFGKLGYMLTTPHLNQWGNFYMYVCLRD